MQDGNDYSPLDSGEDDRWFYHLGDEIPEDSACLLWIERADGSAEVDSDPVEWARELRASAPAQFLRLQLAVIAEVMDPSCLGVLN
jgi:hypothetical protein